MTLSTGQRLGSYEILGPLGAGGMGEVYVARDGRLDRKVALKTLPERLVRDPAAFARFEREAKALATLNHPGILGIVHRDLCVQCGLPAFGPVPHPGAPLVRFEMAITREDFQRLLPAAVGPGLQACEGGFLLEGQGRTCRIRLTGLPPRNLCRLRLPQLAVEVDLQGYGPGEAEAFMARFWDHYRRGGG